MSEPIRVSIGTGQNTDPVLQVFSRFCLRSACRFVCHTTLRFGLTFTCFVGFGSFHADVAQQQANGVDRFGLSAGLRSALSVHLDAVAEQSMLITPHGVPV